MGKKIRKALSHMQYAPIVFISCHRTPRSKTFGLINNVFEQANRRIDRRSTVSWRMPWQDAVAREKGSSSAYTILPRPASAANFIVFLSDAELFHYSYQRYIENRIRDVCGFEAPHG